MTSDRGVSTLLGYAVTLGVTTLLVTGLIVATGGYIQDQRERTTRTELTVIGHQLASDLTSADTLVRREADTVVLHRNLPQQAAGLSYVVAVNPPACSSCILLSANQLDVTARIQFTTVTPVSPSNVTGGPVEVRFNPSTGRLEVVNA